MSKRVYFTTTDEAYAMLSLLVDAGLHGRTVGEICRRLVEHRLAEMLDEEPLRSVCFEEWKKRFKTT